MTETVQKTSTSNAQSEQHESSNAVDDGYLDKSWSGLYRRWKSQLERDFEKNPANKIKLYLDSVTISSLVFLTSIVTNPAMVLWFGFLTLISWFGLIKEWRDGSMSKMTFFTIAAVVFSVTTIMNPVLTSWTTTIWYIYLKLR